jgi:hypothetical protein
LDGAGAGAGASLLLLACLAFFPLAGADFGEASDKERNTLKQ